MLLIIIVLLLILGIAFHQVTQGFYSALIMAVLTVACAVLAFNYYEPLAAALRDTIGSTAEGLALMVLFGLPLLALRFLVDALMPSNAVTGVWLDRIGGGVLGLFSGITAIGVVLVGLQMLPLPATIMGYTAYNDSLQRQDRLAPFYPDEFVVGMVDTLSAGSFSGEQAFARQHDNLLRELFASRVQLGQTRRVDNVDVKEHAGRTDATANALSVLGVYDAGDANWASEIPQVAGDATSSKIVVVRVSIDPVARDTDNWYRLPAAHFRLVAQSGASFYPVAYLTAWEEVRTAKATTRAAQPAWKPILPPKEDNALQITRLGVQRGNAGRQVVDWVFRVPADDKLASITFRRVATQSLGEPKPGLPDEKDALSRLAPAK